MWSCDVGYGQMFWGNICGNGSKGFKTLLFTDLLPHSWERNLVGLLLLKFTSVCLKVVRVSFFCVFSSKTAAIVECLLVKSRVEEPWNKFGTGKLFLLRNVWSCLY